MIENLQVLILGVDGQIGHRLAIELGKHFRYVWGTTRSKFQKSLACKHKQDLNLSGIFHEVKFSSRHDLWSFNENVLKNLKPNYVINAAGMVKSRIDNLNMETLFVNSYLPHFLASRHRFKLIHFSTDCVFSGKSNEPYSVYDEPDADDVYGVTKLLGECSDSPLAMVLRTSMVGRELKTPTRGLLEWFLGHSKGSTIKGYVDHYFSGLSTIEIAKVIAQLLVFGKFTPGLYNLAGNMISKYDLLKIFNECFQRECEIIPYHTDKVYRVLSGEKFRQEFGYISPTWKDMVTELVEDPFPYHMN